MQSPLPSTQTAGYEPVAATPKANRELSDDEHYMRRCLRLAANGLGRTRPNPMVGCVVVGHGRVLSEGYHQCCGSWHAERNALDAMLRVPPSELRGATLYVNLEPCSHHGKTPPCADLVVERGIARVVCCNDDPNPLVAGRGFEKLRAAGIEVVRHVLEAEGRWLNRRFFTAMEQGRPYVVLKWAESADGFMAPATEGAYWLSTQQQNRLNHRWRTEEAAIMVGSETYLRDRPRLTARHFVGPQPQAVVVDRRSRLSDVPSSWWHLVTATPELTLQELHRRGVQSVIVEGGRQMLEAYLGCSLADEVRLLRSPQSLDAGLPAPRLNMAEWQPVGQSNCGENYFVRRHNFCGVQAL